MDSTRYQTVILAGLLHDIGKLLGRGHGAMHEPGRHPEISAKFVAKFAPCFAEVADADLLRELVQRHHEDPRMGDACLVQAAEPSVRPLALLVSRADNYSSMERGEGGGTRDYKTVPLASVFARLQIHDDRPRPAPNHYALAPLAPTVAFPSDLESLDPGEVNDHLAAFGAEANAVFEHMDRRTFASVFCTLMTLLHRYCWCMPSNTQEQQPDVSLYDHMRTTSAIAACLYQYHGDAPEERAVRADGEEKFILVAGDVSGIQRYIFDITNIGVGGAAKRLRARSFFISLLTEAVTLKLLRLFDLPPANVLMASGGKFYALVPKLPDAEARLQGLRRELDAWCHAEMKASLAFNIAALPMAGTDFEAFDRPLSRLAALLAEKKRRPLADRLVEDGGWNEDAFVFEDIHLQQDEAICRSCRKFAGEPRGDDGTILCRHCNQDVLIGQRLPRAGFVAFYDRPDAGRFRVLDLSFDLPGDASHVSGTPVLLAALEPKPEPQSFRFPVLLRHLARHIPIATQEDCDRHNKAARELDLLRPGMPLFFQHIAARSRGRPVLGWLKADVDRLGALFREGLRREAARVRSVSRIATMSRMLDLFFGGWVQAALESSRPDVYTIYSGGDDLLVLGPWDQILEFARELQGAFAEFTNGNANITLSAGIALATSRGPVLRAAEAADRALELAKEKAAKGERESREQFCAFGHIVKWRGVDHLLTEGKRLADWLADGPATTSFVRHLLTYGRMSRAFDQTGEAFHLRFLPMMTYDIARNLAPPDDRDPDRRALRHWAESAKNRTGPLMPHMTFLASYALTACRGRERP